MGSVVYFEESAVDWLEIPDAWEGKVAKGEPDVRYKLLTAGGDGVPGIQFVEFDAGHHEQAHSHAESEVLWVQSGEVTIGGHTLRAGSGAFIEKDTVYGPLIAGSDGTRFLRIGLGA